MKLMSDFFTQIKKHSNNIIAATIIDMEAKNSNKEWKGGIEYIGLTEDGTQILVVPENKQGMFFRGGVHETILLRNDVFPKEFTFSNRQFISCEITHTNEREIIVQFNTDNLSRQVCAIPKWKLKLNSLQNPQSRFYSFKVKSYREKHGIILSPKQLVDKLFPEKFNQLQIEAFNSIFIEKRNIEILDSDRILEVYDGSNYYDPSSGVLGGSCMRYKSCNPYMLFYAKNHVKIVVLWRDGLVAGRALLWENVETDFLSRDESYSFMDRIYTNEEKDVMNFIEFAKENGFIYKRRQSYDDKIGFIYKNKEYTGHIKYKLEKFHFQYYPYADTLSFLEFPYVSNDENDRGDGVITSTGGDISGGHSGVYCELDGQTYHSRNETIWSNISETYILRSKSYRSKDGKNVYHKEDALSKGLLTKCPKCGEIVDPTELVDNGTILGCAHCTIKLYNSEIVYTSDEIFEFNFKWYKKSDGIYSDILDSLIPTEGSIFIDKLNSYIPQEYVEDITKMLQTLENASATNAAYGTSITNWQKVIDMYNL